MMKTVVITIAAVVLLLILMWVLGILAGYYVSSRRWNGGRCPRCGTPWKYWKSNKYGDRLYYCPDCLKTCTIVYDVDKIKEGGDS